LVFLSRTRRRRSFPDVDGTLVDSNYQHAIAWHRAFHEHGYRAAVWEIHRHVGMGGDHEAELREVGAAEVSHSIAALREHGVEWVLGLAGTSAS
jgi:beta-phosphoglucomutase-like phosphatase (HAD superfamily)